MKRLVIFALLALPACEDPTLGVGATISNDGVAVSPVYTGRSGGVSVAVSG